MDFALSDAHEELRGLADRILGDACTPDRLRAVAESDTGTDAALWRTMAHAGLVGIGVPEPVGGGLGWLGTAVVLEAVGRHAAPVPAFAVMALAAPALADAGDPGGLLAGVAAGDVVVTAAVHEPNGDLFAPATSVDGDRLSGAKTCVGHGALGAGRASDRQGAARRWGPGAQPPQLDGGVATHFVVTTSDGLWLVDAAADGVRVEAQGTSSGPIDALVTFSAAQGVRLGDAAARDRLGWRGISGACLISAGACATALRLTADYTKGREQFGKPIASFQAVSQRAADAYVDAEAVRLTAWQAAWRLANGLEATEQLLTAKFWAAEGGWRVIHAAHHLHGGAGVDRDYPLYHYLLLLQRMELQLGSATPSLVALGDHLADASA